MRYLLLCHSFPGLMSPIAAWLAARPDSQTFVASTWFRNGPEMPGMKKILIKKPKNLPLPENYPDYWANAAKVGRHALFSLQSLAASGFIPDIVFSCSTGGAALALPDVFPDAFVVNYLDFSAGGSASEEFFRNSLQGLQVAGSKLNFSFCQSAIDSLPLPLRKNILPAPLGVNTGYFRCDGAFEARRDIIVLLCANAEDAQKCMQMAREINEACPGCKYVLLASTLRIKNYAQGLAEGFPELANILMSECNPPSEMARRLYNVARVLISPERDLRPEMLEALACGIPAILAAQNRHLKNGKNCLEYVASGGEIVNLLKDQALLAKIGARGVKDAAKYFDINNVVEKHMEYVLGEWEKIRAQ